MAREGETEAFYSNRGPESYGIYAIKYAQLPRNAGDEELAPGITVHRVGGHTMGLQVTRVWTRRGWVVLASDATHFYANMRQTRPFPIVFDVGEMVAGSETFNRLASSPDHIIPGHDPLALECYPAAKPGLEGIVARLDVDPSMPPS